MPKQTAKRSDRTTPLQKTPRLQRPFPCELKSDGLLDEYPLLLESASAPAAFDPVRREMRAQGEALLNEAFAATQQLGVQAEMVLREGVALRVAQAIVKESIEAGCDLIVMGTHGRRGIDRLVVGSDAEAVIRTSAIPVLLVKAAPAA
jgi:nucleotide-binding universal stress UspA family protein